MSEKNYNLHDLISDLPGDHQKKILWSFENKNKISPWAEISKKNLAIIPKGIYKPKNYTYALSMKTVIDSPYDDGDVFIHPRTSEWMALYRPERDIKSFTNKALLACERDLIPVIYFKQTSKKPNTAYRVIGPCLVTYHVESNYFFLFGFSDDGVLENHIFSN